MPNSFKSSVRKAAMPVVACVAVLVLSVAAGIGSAAGPGQGPTLAASPRVAASGHAAGLPESHEAKLDRGVGATVSRGPVRPAQGAGLAATEAAPALLDIMAAELDRNVAVLSKQPSPLYYLAYTVHDSNLTMLGASAGAVTTRHREHERVLAVEARVGSYDLDSTHEIRGDWTSNMGGMSRTLLPLTDDPDAIRLILWRATDRHYKRAAERFTKVKANVAAKVQEESPAPDFSREEPERHLAPVQAATFEPGDWEPRLRRISAPFATDPKIFQAEVTLTVENRTRYLVSSEGARLVTLTRTARVDIHAVTKADDGMQLPLSVSYAAPTEAGLPPEGEMLTGVRQIMDLLKRLREAPVVDPYSGPAILSGRASAVFFHEIFGHRVEGHRQKEAEEGQTFAKMVGQPILPSFLTVISDPTLATFNGVHLLGHYEFDDEGVAARRVVVVRHGVLEGFLLSRSPIEGFPRSNGHGRAYPGMKPVARQSNLIIESSRRIPDTEIIERLKEECRKQGKPFGLLFDNIEGGFTFTGRDTPNAFNVLPTVVYRVPLDGRPPELVRGVDLIGTPLAAFSKISATGTAIETFNGMCGAESGMVPVSVSSPALLVSEVEVQKKAKSQETLPILPAPPRRGGAQRGGLR